MTLTTQGTPAGPRIGARKVQLTQRDKALRLLKSVLDPRAYLHALRIINYYNTTHVQPRRTVTIGPRPSISPTVSFSHGERIFLGADVRLNARAALWAGPSRGRIVLGNHVMFAPDVLATAANYRFNDGSPVTEQRMDEADILVGDDVWVGAKAVLLPGTEIGEGAIIAAGAVVRGQIPPYAIVSGNPGQIVGQRQRPVPPQAPAPAGGSGSDSATLPLATGRNPAVDAVIAREHPGLSSVLLEGPVAFSGLDSFDLITLRSALETALNVSIPDREWAGCERLVDLARLPSLTDAHPVADMGYMPQTASDLAPDTAAAGGIAAQVDGHGRARREFSLNMPQMALSGLSEAWLFRELGDMHWDMITSFLGSDSSAITDAEGDRLYATFTRIVLEVDPMLRAFPENSRCAITSQLERYGASFFWGHHDVDMLHGPRGATGMARARATTMSTFAKYGERGRNTSLIKGTPIITRPEAIPILSEFPEFGANYRARRGAAATEALFSCDYEIQASHDINGVGLLYFAAYPTIFDQCLDRAEGRGFLIRHSTVKKDICYFANSEPDETLVFQLHDRTEEGDILRQHASLSRKSDGVRMAEVISEKRRLDPA